MEISEEDIVKKCCELMEVKYSHYDREYGSGERFHAESRPKLVVYSGMSPWEFAILEDMTIHTPFNFTIKLFSNDENFGTVDFRKEMIALGNKIEVTNKYLQSNSEFSKIINDPEKELS